MQALLNTEPALEAGNGATTAAPFVPIEQKVEEEQEQQNSKNKEGRDEIERIDHPPLIMADAEHYPM